MAKTTLDMNHTEQAALGADSGSAESGTATVRGIRQGVALGADEELIYSSPLMASIHEAAEGLAQIGAISSAEMKEYDEACLKKNASV